jgi:hypothetical protein
MVAFAFTSCGSDDDGGASDSVTITGTWNLTSFGGETPTDLNGDGSANANIITETGCYQDDNIVFQSGGAGETNQSTYADIELTDNGDGTFDYSVACVSDPSSDAFTWTQSGNSITITQGTQSFVATQDGNQLTFTIPEGYTVEVEDGDCDID